MGKRIILVVFCMMALLAGTISVGAVQDLGWDGAAGEAQFLENADDGDASPKENGNGAEDWQLNGIGFSHLGVTFTLDHVSQAQEATAVITSEEDETIAVELPISITSASQEFRLSFPAGVFLPPGSHILTVRGQDGGSVSGSGYLRKCYMSSEVLDYDAYPMQFEADYSPYKKGLIKKAVAEVGFAEYEGVVGEDGIVIPYPRQEIGAKVVVTLSDGYGCEITYEDTIENENLDLSDLVAYGDSVRVPHYLPYWGIYPERRVAVNIGGNVYYGEYGGEPSNPKIAVTYPPQQAGAKIDIWMESKNGSVSDVKTVAVKACDYEGLDLMEDFLIFARPTCFKEKITANFEGQRPTLMRIWIGSQKYEGKVQADGSFEITYPYQEDGTKMILEATDAHGCSEKTSVKVRNDLAGEKPDFDVEQISTVKVYDCLAPGIRLCVEVNGKVYYSEYTKKKNGEEFDDEDDIRYFFYDTYKDVEIVYPYQKPGTTITVWYEMKNGSRTPKVSYEIPKRKVDIKIKQITATYAKLQFGVVQAYFKKKWRNLYGSDMKRVYAYVNGTGKAYQSDRYGRNIKYKAKVGDSIKFVAEDTEGYTYEATGKVINIPPKIKINDITSSDTKVTGKTNKNADVTLQIGKKKYKTKSKKDGSFSVKIKPQKPKTKIKVTVKTQEGYHGSKTCKVKMAKGYISILKIVYRSSKSVACKITGAAKGDVVEVKIGAKTYTKKITSAKKTQKLTISIGSHSAGENITATYYDRYHHKKSYVKSMVYLGDTIYVGMTEQEVVLTTWGKPVRKNDYGSFKQWVFVAGRTTLYVYIRMSGTLW